MTATLRRADPTQQLVSCPGWTVRELASHLIGVHRWGLRALTSETAPPYDETPVGEDLAVAYAAAGQDLVAALRALPPDAPCWTFDRDNRTASFWRRRQVHEISVHRWDIAAHPLTDDVAGDGIDEVLDVLVPGQLARGRAVFPAGSLRLQAPDQSWVLGGAGPITTVSGSRSDLLLWLWGRIHLDASGDPAAWRAVTFTP